MRIVKAGYWGEEYLDAVKHEMGVGDGDPAPELPPGIDVPEAVKPVVEKMYQELLASEAPDPKYFLQGVQVAVLDYFDGKVEPYTRAATTAEILADGFAAEEFFSWRGGSPEYSFWTMHSNAISDLSAMLDIDPDVLFDDLGKLAVQAAVEEGTKLTQEIQEAMVGVTAKLMEMVDEDWEQPLSKVVALWNQFLDTEVENPRDVTVEDLMSLLGSMDDYNNQYGEFGGDFEEAAKQVLPGLAKQILMAPDPRQTEIPFPKRRGRPQKHFYKKSSVDRIAAPPAWPREPDFSIYGTDCDTFVKTHEGQIYLVYSCDRPLFMGPRKVDSLPPDATQIAVDLAYDVIDQLPDWLLDKLSPSQTGLMGDMYRQMGRGGNTRRAASDQDLIERYLGTEGPEAFNSVEEIEEYFKPESLDYMFGSADGHPDAEAAHKAVLNAWQQRHGSVDADVQMLDAIWTDVDSEVAHILDAKYYESMSPRPGTSLMVGSLGKVSYSGVKHYISVVEQVTPDKLRGLPVEDLEKKEYYRLVFSLYQQACYTVESYLNAHSDHTEYGTYRVHEARISGTGTQIYFMLAN